METSTEISTKSITGVLIFAAFLYGVITIGLLTLVIEGYTELDADGDLQFEEADGTKSNRWGFKQVVFVSMLFACFLWLPLIILGTVFVIAVELFVPDRRRHG